MDFNHTPIMLEECMNGLQLFDAGIYIDGTLGGGGHTFEILKRSKGIVLGIDRDEEALKASRQRCLEFSDSLIQIHGNFFDMKNIIPQEYVGKIDGILLDLGVSSYQLDNAERGFSYMKDGNLDMRMDSTQDFSAIDVVNGYSEKQLTEIFYKYGEENWSKRVAKFIVEKRQEAKIETTSQLVDIIKSAIPAAARRSGPHPATRVFQAIRIEVNGELQQLGVALNNMIDILAPGGRLCVITFHSLEDRIVKQTFKSAQNPCVCPPKCPTCICGAVSKGKVITNKPIIPNEDEINTNPRSRSAKLRIFQRV